MRDLAFTAAWLVFVPVALQAGAHVGVLLWAWTSVLAPNDVLYGFATSFPFAKIAAGVTLLLLVMRRGGGVDMRFRMPEMLLLALALFSVAAQAGSPMNDAGAGWDLVQKYLKVLLLGFVAISVMTDRVRIHALILTLCLGMGFTGVDEGLKFVASGGAHHALGSPSLGDNNQLALNVLLIIPLLQHLFAVLKHRLVRLAVAGSMVLSILGVVATFSRGAFAGLALIGVASALSSKRKVVGIAIVALLAVGGLRVVGQDYVNRMDTIQNVEGDDSFMGRVSAWKVSTLAALARPLGTGMHGIQHGEIWWKYAPDVNSLPLFPKTDPQTGIHAAHSIWFEVLGDLGFPGLAAFVALVFTSIYSAWRTRRRIRAANRPDLEWARDLALRLQISLIVFALSGSLLSAAYYDMDYLIVALVVALQRNVAKELAQAPRTAGFAPLQKAWRPGLLAGARRPSVVRGRVFPT